MKKMTLENIWGGLTARKLNGWLPDRLFISITYMIRVGKPLNLRNPRGYNEKLQWLKLYDHNPDYPSLVDKCEVKKRVARIIGEEYVVPTYGIWDSVEKIDFNCLPNQFVLKCTHDSGGLIICKDKNQLDIKKAKEKLKKSLNTNFYKTGREWAYKLVKPRIIAEQYMEDQSTEELRDYKFFVFNGKVKALYVATDRQKEKEETKFDFFDENYVHLPIKHGHENATVLPEKPVSFEKMKNLACKLADNYPHVRVDFYEVDGKIYFGEMTFYHQCGFVPFTPPEWDKIFGDWLVLPDKEGTGL